MKLRSVVAQARHDPDCATTVDHREFRRVPDIAHVIAAPLTDHQVRVRAMAASDVHAFASWFARECDGAECVQDTAWIAEVRPLLQHRISAASVAQLAHLGRTTRDLHVMLDCRDEIERRWRQSLSYEVLVLRVEKELAQQEGRG